MKILIVDDEWLARSRIKTLLMDANDPAIQSIHECSSADSAMPLVDSLQPDLVLLDIHMPGMDGMTFASQLRQRSPRPGIIFITAHAEHALQAFDVEAVDYLTKPVRLDRLVQALKKFKPDPAHSGENIVIQERGRTLLVPLNEVIYFKAELKYITVRTRTAAHLLEASLSDLESKYGQQYLRVHRNALVLKSAIRSLERGLDAPLSDSSEGWNLRLQGIDETIAVSRRQLVQVRDLLRQLGG